MSSFNETNKLSKTNRGTNKNNNEYALKFKYIQDIYFFEVNTKYISSNVLKISVISRVRSRSEMADIFNTCNEIVLVFTKKSKFSFYFFPLRGKNLTFFMVISR